MRRPGDETALSLAGIIDRASQPEIGDTDPFNAVLQQDVGRLDGTIDFVTDSRANTNSDVYTWPVTLRLTTSDKDPGQIWDSTTGFHGPLTVPLNRWQELAQILLMSNEFAFID